MKKCRCRALARRYGHARKVDPRVRARKLARQASVFSRKAATAARVAHNAELRAGVYRDKEARFRNEAGALEALSSTLARG